MLFVDRADAGGRLARWLGHLRGTDAVVLGLPRGGVPVAFEVARELQAPGTAPATSSWPRRRTGRARARCWSTC